MAEKQYEIRTVKTVMLSVMQADRINCLKQLEILDFGPNLASRQRLPVLKRTKRCVFSLDFFALLIFVLGARFMRGMAVMYSTPRGISKTRHRLRIPRAFIAGVIARQTEPRPRVGSATTKFTVNGSSPRSTASTEAKKLFKSMQR